MITLEVISGPQQGDTHEIDQFPALLGRSKESAIRLKDQRISRQHARLSKTDNEIFLEDMGSTHGTLLNNVTVQKDALSPGDVIRLVSVELKVISINGKTLSPSGQTPRSRGLSNDSVPTQPIAPQQTIVQFSHNAAISPSASVVIEAGDRSLKLAGQGATSRELDRANERLFTMIDVASQLTSIRDVHRLLEEIMNRLFQIFRQAERGFILLKDEQGELKPEIVRNQSVGGGNVISVSSTVLNRVVQEKKALILGDISQNAEFAQAASIVIHQTASMMVAPLLYREEVLGAVHIDTTVLGRSFREEDLNLLAGIASGAAIALKNALLLEEVRREATVRTALARHLSPALVEQFLQGNLDLEQVGGEVRKGTVFFSDLVGFTSMAERLKDPRAVVELLNHYFGRMETVIFSNGGTIDKFTGDAIMAYWGVLLESETASHDAVQAALEMQNEIPRLNAEIRSKGSAEQLSVGIGMNTGTLLAGNIGSHQKIEFTLIGDNVNLAQRIESLANRGQVLISRSTYEEVASEVVAIRMPSVHVKNKADAVELFSVRAIRSRQVPDSVVCSISVSVAIDQSLSECLIIEAGCSSEGPVKLELLGTATFQIGNTIIVKPHIGEFPDLPPLQVEVVSQAEAREDDPDELNSWVCQATELPKEWRDLIRPGTLLTSPLNAGDLKRQ
ncbi:MAG: FHA domain-containing protein [Acidobacteriota bacterium]|nr:MAG: FHA domain-containing protein [Acidobacteriota bacterium]